MFRNPASIAILTLVCLLTASCATSRYGRGAAGYSRPAGAGRPAAAALPRSNPRGLKDNRPSLWISDHPRVARFRAHYMKTRTVEKALRQGRRYLPTITRVFKSRRLPLELAYLPMLESMFENSANSGSARGLWQFTRQTARHMGLRVGAFSDERLNWYKATLAAADYLEELGAKFNYNWALALAAYNGGPGYIERRMKSQRTWNYFSLRLRKETHEYVPRFVAMVQVAKEKYTHLLVATR